MYIMIVSRSVTLRMRAVSDKSYRENENTHFMSSNFFSPPKFVPFCEIMWKNSQESDRPQMTIWCICIACRIPKATNTHSEYVIINDFSTATMVAQMRLNFFVLHALPVLFKV
jgi:hypothetical protein